MNPLLASLPASCNILKHSFSCPTEFCIFQRTIQSEEFYIFISISSTLWCNRKGTIAHGNMAIWHLKGQLLSCLRKILGGPTAETHDWSPCHPCGLQAPVHILSFDFQEAPSWPAAGQVLFPGSWASVCGTVVPAISAHKERMSK